MEGTGAEWFFLTPFLRNQKMTTHRWTNAFNELASGVSLNAKIDGEIASNELNKIYDDNGGYLTSGQIVKAAEPKRAKFHKLIEWDDAKASHRYRLEQASLIVRSVKIIIESNENEEDTEIREFTSIRHPEKKDGTRVFIRTIEGMSRRDTQFEILQQCLLGLQRWRKRWAAYNELAESIELIDKATRSIEELVSKAE